MTSASTGAKQQGIFLSTAYTIRHDESKITVYSLAEFDSVAFAFLLYQFVSERADERADCYDIEFAGETADMLVPGPESLDALVTFLLWNRAFLSDALDHYAEGNILSGAHIIYEHIYQHVITLFEEQWDDVAQVAKRLLKRRQIPYPSLAEVRALLASAPCVEP